MVMRNVLVRTELLTVGVGVTAREEPSNSEDGLNDAKSF